MAKFKVKINEHGIVVMPGANLQGANIQELSLQLANLQGANLREANLEEACLIQADLKRANLERADLRGADLEGANLERADLRGADLEGADLQGAILYKANLRGANLKLACLYNADLQGADLRGADLQGANLRDADLQGANIEDVKGIDDVPKKPIPGLPARVLEQIKNCPESFEMDSWHSECGTRHCFAGWAVTLAGDAGKAAEKRLDTPVAAALLLGGSDHPFNSYDGEKVIPWLEARVEEEEETK